MAKRYMSSSEYVEQQFYWKHELIDPEILSEVIDSKFASDDLSNEYIKQKKEDLKQDLLKLIMKKIDTDLTGRQREAILLFLQSRKQEHMAEILHISQEAANVRLKLGLIKLRDICKKDNEIANILNQINDLN